jgi:hypothetical protein
LGVGNWLAERFEKLCLWRTQVLVLALATNPNSIANHLTGARPVRACWGNSSGSSCSSRRRIGEHPIAEGLQPVLGHPATVVAWPMGIVETGTQSYRLATSKTSNRKRAS